MGLNFCSMTILNCKLQLILVILFKMLLKQRNSVIFKNTIIGHTFECTINRHTAEVKALFR